MLEEIEKLSKIRKELNISVEKLAREIQVAANSLRRYFRGDRPIDAILNQIKIFNDKHSYLLNKK